jgi:hypothetical protein
VAVAVTVVVLLLLPLLLLPALLPLPPWRPSSRLAAWLPLETGRRRGLVLFLSRDVSYVLYLTRAALHFRADAQKKTHMRVFFGAPVPLFLCSRISILMHPT